MPYPESWAKAAIETAGSCLAYPLIAPESAALPYVIYGRSSTSRETIMAGDIAVNVSPSAEFVVEIYAATYSASKVLADLLRDALHNFTGTANGVTINQALLIAERDGEPIFFDGQDQPTFVIEHTYQIRWQE